MVPKPSNMRFWTASASRTVFNNLICRFFGGLGLHFGSHLGSKIHQKTFKNINGFAPDSEMDFESILASCWLSFLYLFGNFFEYVSFSIFATPMMRFACFSRSVTSKIHQKTIRKQHRKQNTKLNCIFMILD